MKIYKKLVRDNIPSIITNDGGIPIIRRLKDKEFRTEALKKVVEEAKEILKAKDSKEDLIKEIADIEEILLTLMEVYKITPMRVRKVRIKRRKERGGFKKRIFLEKVK